MKKWQKIDIQTKGDYRGSLSVIESNEFFSIQRVYYLHGHLGDSSRGAHAHKNLNQVIVAVAGSCRIKLNDGLSSEEFTLSRPTQGLRVYPMVWRDIYDFSKDCVLMVFADQLYDEDDYIRDIKEFDKLVKQRGALV